MEATPMFVLIALVVLGIFILITVVKTMYTVRTYTAGVVERFGKFNRIAQPGLHFLVPWCETVRFMDLQIRQADVNVETKSKDNVFVTIPVSVQYQVLPDKVFEAYYKLSSRKNKSRATSSTPSSVTFPPSPSMRPSSSRRRSPPPSNANSTPS
ncbi:MAG: SPFH domain-containing protein [Acidobacteriaceae bacterium]